MHEARSTWTLLTPGNPAENHLTAVSHLADDGAEPAVLHVLLDANRMRADLATAGGGGSR